MLRHLKEIVKTPGFLIVVPLVLFLLVAVFGLPAALIIGGH